MAVFHQETLESYKYADLVKIAKENDVYRRYAPKAELIQKLLSKNEPAVETLNDVSMPSFMEEDDSDETNEDSGSTSLQLSNKSKPTRVSTGIHNKWSVKRQCSPCVPLTDKGQRINMSTAKPESPLVASNKKSTTEGRRSLAGPAKREVNRHRTKRQPPTGSQDMVEKENNTSQSSTRRVTRQQTSDTDNPETSKENKRQRLKREGTFEVEHESTGKMRREGTFDVEPNEVGHRSSPSGSPLPVKLRREGTFEVKDVKPEEAPEKCKIRREGTFEVEDTSISRVLRVSLKRSSQSNLSTKSPHQPKRISIATPSVQKSVDRSTNGQSVPRRFITARTKPTDLASPGSRKSASKSKIPSLMNEIQKKKAEVSAKKVAISMGEKPVLGKKPPDFGAIHKRLFGKMESIVDSHQKVIDKVNSIQKIHRGQKSPPNTKVVRKLLSPKAGKSKLVSPKPVLGPVASAFASKVQIIQRRSIGSTIPGVTKLQSPRPNVESKLKAFAGTGSRVAFPKAEPSRKEVLKASVISRQPTKRNSPMAKAKKALQSVRLNKRFELQMKHRLAQQSMQ